MRDRLAGWLLVQPPHRPPYVLEPVPALPGWRIASLFGVDWYLSRYGWLAPLWVFGAALLVARRTAADRSGTEIVRLGAAYALCTAGSMVWHQIGQLIGGKIVGAPLSGVVFTATLAYQTYPQEGDQPRHVHLARALGGPVAHVLLGLAALGGWRVSRGNGLLGYLAALNLAFALASMAPIPTMDGGVVFRELRRGRD